MSAETLSMQQKRQAIAKGLEQYFSAAALERELNYWEEAYGDKPAFVLNRFVNDICSTTELREQRREILRQVLHEMAEAEREAHHLPRSEHANSHADAVALRQLKEGFTLFLNHVMQYVSNEERADFNLEVKFQLDDLNFRLNAAVEISSAQFCDYIPSSRYAECLTVVYTQYCNFYGPSRADYVYARGKELLKTKFPQLNLDALL